MRHFPGTVAVVVICGLLVTRAAWGEEPTAAVAAERVKFFETQVRPLLAANCYECHGEKKQKGGLRLDSAEAVAKGGKNGAVLVAGKPGESKLILAVSYKDDDFQMPPEEQLSAEQVEVLTRWVAMGAPFPTNPAGLAGTTPAPKSKKRTITDEDRAFWSFQPPKAIAPPEVPDAAWSKNPIDRFVFAKLAAEGLTPAPLADRATLVRRAYLDLWGLPPTPQQVEAFVNDPSPGAWENLIDALLASPRYGERMATHWMDVVRYAESDGYKADSYRPNAWPYR